MTPPAMDDEEEPGTPGVLVGICHAGSVRRNKLSVDMNFPILRTTAYTNKIKA